MKRIIVFIIIVILLIVFGSCGAIQMNDEEVAADVSFIPTESFFEQIVPTYPYAETISNEQLGATGWFKSIKSEDTYEEIINYYKADFLNKEYTFVNNTYHVSGKKDDIVFIISTGLEWFMSDEEETYDGKTLVNIAMFNTQGITEFPDELVPPHNGEPYAITQTSSIDFLVAYYFDESICGKIKNASTFNKDNTMCIVIDYEEETITLERTIIGEAENNYTYTVTFNTANY